jgi:dipeptidyl aminopeptidase/acylaminoacyl peptidase
VLYEILTGRRAFEGSSPASVIAAIMERPAGVAPPALDHVLKTCLAKGPDERWQSARDLWRELEWIASASESGSAVSAAPMKKSQRGWVAWSVAALAIACALGVSYIHFREKPPINKITRFEIPAPAGANFATVPGPVVSPDGRKIAFIATGADRRAMVWVRSLDTEEARPLTGTEDAQYTLIWSPESRYLAFASGGKLKKIEATGGPAPTLCDAPTPGPGGDWTSDNRIIFGGLGTLQLVSAAGGMPAPLTVLDRSRGELAHESPVMLPDGHHFVYLRFSEPQENGGAYVGSLDTKPELQSTKRLLPDTSDVVYVPSPPPGDASGLLLFVRGITFSGPDATGTLMAQPFDPKRMELANEAVPIAEQVAGFGGFSASPAGILAFSNGGAQGNSKLTLVDRKGSVLSTVGETGQHRSVAFSPDGARIAYERGTDLWLFEFARGGVNTKFTFGYPATQPAWSADGSRIVFLSIRASGFSLYQKDSNSSGQEKLLLE